MALQSTANILVIRCVSFVLGQCLDCVVPLGCCQSLGPEFDLEDAQNTMEGPVFHIQVNENGQEMVLSA